MQHQVLSFGDARSTCAPGAAAQAPPVHHQLLSFGDARYNGAAGGAASPARLQVRCANDSMYGRQVTDLLIAGVHITSPAVVRFRAMDDKVAIADLLAVVYHTMSKHAHEKIRKLQDTRDDRIVDLASLEFDHSLLSTVIARPDTPVCRLRALWPSDVCGRSHRAGPWR